MSMAPTKADLEALHQKPNENQTRLSQQKYPHQFQKQTRWT